ncbi:hypothetical protein FH972_025669 [Carpinus fangiana]|uniref:Uncharacterized protein n=1 Tax=Carpinus fangiana TaxID=176857 RepID=A0A5N6L1N5_9ROSI|nr:hypothetical protein FH972_025669 [Carpinus fangiana]
MSSLAASPLVAAECKHAMESPSFRRPAASNITTPMPLGSLPPDRVQNTPRFGQTSVPQSPSLPIIGSSPPKHVRQNSDVQGMVARFNSLDIKDHAELRKRDEAALRRAQMGREEAETELRRIREEARRLEKEQAESKDQLRKVMKRNDVLMVGHNLVPVDPALLTPTAGGATPRQRDSPTCTEPEELKAARNQLRVNQADLASEKQKVERKDQDVFQAQYEIVGVQEKLAQALAHVKIVEEERDALKTNLKEEEVARIAAQGQIALPPSLDELDEFATPKKMTRALPATHNASKMRRDLEDMRVQLEFETRKRIIAQEQVDFMKMECQFGCCSCRVAESRGSHYIYDTTFAHEAATVKTTASTSMHMDIDEQPDNGTLELNLPQAIHIQEKPRSPETRPTLSNDAMQDSVPSAAVPFALHAEPSSQTPVGKAPSVPAHIELLSCGNRVDSPLSTTGKVQSETSAGRGTPVAKEALAVRATTDIGMSRDLEEERSEPQTPGVAVRTITHTTTIPLVDESTPGYSAFFAPGSTLTREEALERIRERRGRARSVTGTPKRSASVGIQFFPDFYQGLLQYLQRGIYGPGHSSSQPVNPNELSDEVSEGLTMVDPGDT